MSKSKGNVIDPLEIMAKYGTDAFRFTLAAMAAMGRDIKLAEDRIAGYQSFVNKLWNAARFVQLNLADANNTGANRRSRLASGDLDLTERWIRSRLAATIREAREALASYRFNDYSNALYQFTWHEFCDWYIEMSKVGLNGADAAQAAQSRQLLRELLEQILLLLHPIMPFVTEEIWQSFGAARPSIMKQKYPALDLSWIDAEVEKRMDFLMGVIRAIRNLRTELNCLPGKEVKVLLFGPQTDLDFLRTQQPYLRALARVASGEYHVDGERPKGAATAVVGGTEIYLPLDDLVNLDEERARLTKEVGKAEEELARVQKKLDNGDFLAKAKQEIIQKERDKASQFGEKIRTLRTSLAKLEEIQAGRD
jgi:valyl-tRNA synthetase